MFTPHYCGCEFPEMRPEINRMAKDFEGAYQDTAAWAYAGGGISLGTAVSISGAAVSPNMGYHTYAPLAFLMTVFNVRLGVWLANPRYSNDKYRPRPDGGPAFSLLYLINELLGSATDTSKYAYLSDGAHFENLALYELVRRQCDFIIAGDAGEDPEFGFGDLVNAIRKCRTDLGAEIQLTLGPLRLTGQEGASGAHAIFGTVKYANRERPGQLLYIRPASPRMIPKIFGLTNTFMKHFPTNLPRTSGLTRVNSRVTACWAGDPSNRSCKRCMSRRCATAAFQPYFQNCSSARHHCPAALGFAGHPC